MTLDSDVVAAKDERRRQDLRDIAKRPDRVAVHLEFGGRCLSIERSARGSVVAARLEKWKKRILTPEQTVRKPDAIASDGNTSMHVWRGPRAPSLE
jgi:hypothetical protein